RLPVPPAHGQVLHRPGDGRDHGVAGGELQGVGMNDSVADRVRTAWTSAPWRINSCASFTVSTAAMLPVIPRTIVLPWSFVLFRPRRRSAGCILSTISHARYIAMGFVRTKGANGWSPGNL